MKVTGIVRKIDELGRIVLPKELRQTMNISAGDDFEILMDNEIIILKKFSRIATVTDKIKEIISNFSKNINFNLVVVSNNEVINFENELLSTEIIKILKERKLHINNHGNKIKLSSNLFIENKYIIMPIIINSDLIGGIIAYGEEDTKNMLVICNILLSLIKSYFV